MTNYLIELSVFHLVLIFGYWIFLRNERQYGRMRFYLLMTSLLAILIPFLKLPRLFSRGEDPIAVLTLEPFPVQAISANTVSEQTGGDYSWLIGIYVLVSLFLLIRFVYGIVQLVYLKYRCRPIELNGIKALTSNEIKGSFTFFRWIFLAEEMEMNQTVHAAILKHEKAHVIYGHTFDLIFFELFKIFFWWLPTAWLNLKEIKKIHEYQADAYALLSCHIDQYSKFLINSTLKSNGISLASSFHNGLTFKRLFAMKQQMTKIKIWKLVLLSTLCAFLFIEFACTEELDRDLKEISNQGNTISYDQLPVEMQDELKAIKNQLSYLKINGATKEDVFKLKELQNIDQNLIHSINVHKESNAVYVAMKKAGTNFDYVSDRSKTQGEVFVVVEDQPQFKGGMEAFYRYVSSEMTYPVAARQNGVEGKVDVQFVVERDGSVTNVQVINGIGSGCDEEAVRVVKNSPAFQPGSQRGKAVRVRLAMPIIFKLNPEKKNPDNSAQGFIVIEKVETQKSNFKVDANYDAGTWSGTIYDEEGEPMPGANIVIKGTSRGTVSDLDGTFRLPATIDEQPVISFIGYETVILEK